MDQIKNTIRHKILRISIKSITEKNFNKNILTYV